MIDWISATARALRRHPCGDHLLSLFAAGIGSVQIRCRFGPAGRKKLFSLVRSIE
ncbi:hypothetical protein [Streptomyces sp. NPDC001828]|uniref:hypothetical protein n=1 Tax=Streptomyces sp. NPDC001828 TaxID=3364615 RepID=UPI0036907869